MRRDSSGIFMLTAALVLSACSQSPQATAAPSIAANGRPSSAPASNSPLPPTAAALGIERSGSGIPLELDGEPVFVALAAVDHAAATVDATPFLVGGWFHDATIHACSGGITPVPDLLGGCDTVVGADVPRFGYPGPQGRMFWGEQVLPTGPPPAIVRVHTHDTRARDCPPSDRAECRLVMVVEDVVWTGDEATRTAPRSVPEAVAALGGVLLISEFRIGPKTTLSVGRSLGLSGTPTRCASPWPAQTYAIHGDARLGLIAVFPDTPSRLAAQASLDPGVLPCGFDPRVTRPEPGTFVASDNVLVLVYDKEVADHVATQFVNPTATQKFIPLPGPSVDESFHLIDDVEALRLSGDVESLEVGAASDGDWSRWGQIAVARSAADALTYTIDDAQAVEPDNVPASTWRTLQKAAAPGSARRFVVHHPDSTDPALRTEVLVAFRLLDPDVDTWRVLLVGS